MDVYGLVGSAVRNSSGQVGRVVLPSLPEQTPDRLRVHWEGAKASFVNMKDTSTQLEVLTLDKGWIPLRNLLGVAEGLRPRGLALVEDVREALAMAELLEKGKGVSQSHNPFKYHARLGPGPRGGSNARTSRWKCQCSNYSCKCKGKKGKKTVTKTVNIDPAYKKDYNAEYRAWAKKTEK